MRPAEPFFWSKFWYREKSWQRGLQDERANKPPKPPVWASKRSYNAGYTHRERELAADLGASEHYYRPLEITASTDHFDYEVEDSEHWPPPHHPSYHRKSKPK